MTNDQKFERLLLWTSIISGSIGLACCSVAAPGLYVLLMALLGCCVILGGTFAVFAVNDRNAASKQSPTSNTVVPFTVPGAPRNLTADLQGECRKPKPSRPAP